MALLCFSKMKSTLAPILLLLLSCITLDSRAVDSVLPETVVSNLDNVEDWTVEEKVGQLLMVGFRSYKQIENIKPSGVVLFSWSMKDVEQTKLLTNNLKQYAREHFKSPLFIATDHEGGKVLRLRKGMTHFPDAAAVGFTRDPFLAFKVGKAMGYELAALGINMNLAPVLDVGNAKSFLENRLWGESGSGVAKMTSSFIRGLFSAGILAVAKHFPGHGSSSTDSHFSLPVVLKSKERLWAEDLLPFKEVISEGTPFVMSAHVEIPSLGRGPASLSPIFLHDILRMDLGFKGLVLTDDLEMGGVTKSSALSVEDAAMQSLKAGTDILLVVWSEDVQRRIVSRVIAALKNGEISQKWLDEKVKHILAIKRIYLSVQGSDQIENTLWKESLRTKENLALSSKISNSALHWIAGQENIILKKFNRQWGQPWVVILPTESMSKLWRKFRAKDKIIVQNKRPDASALKSFSRILNLSIEEKHPLVVITGPRASSSEDSFKVASEFMAKVASKSVEADPILWVHQGLRPVDLKWDPALLPFGMMSLHSASLESFKYFLEYMQREVAESRLVVRE